MTRRTHEKRIVGSVVASVAMLVSPALFLAGCDGPVGGGTGVLSGRVTNALTEDGVAGVPIVLDPAVEGLEITTGSDGRFSATVPLGVYSLTVANPNYASQTLVASVLGGQTATADFALMPTAPVIVTASMNGDAVPGGTLTVSANVDVLDGSTVQSYAWIQSNSVDVQIGGASAATATVTLPDVRAFKDELFHVLAEPPIGEDQLPPNVPVHEGEFPGGLQSRFQVIGLNHFTLEETGLVTLAVTVTTTSGTYTGQVQIHTALPWKPTTGLHNVPIGVPVVLHGKNHIDEDGDGRNDVTGAEVNAYNWSLSRPSGSSAALVDATTQNPYFTPDVSGLYTVRVTDTTQEPGTDVVPLNIYAGTWEGAITGQDGNGRPLASGCMVCHNDTIAPDMFTPWAQTGHAEIFTDNIKTSTHYGESCFGCHTVGFDPAANNGGIDEAGDYQDFLNAGLLNNPGDNWTTVLNEFPETAHMANIQCENCHGPQNGGAHTQGAPRVSLSADVCASCHGEPLRHGRFQQWQLSGHANFELAIDEGENGNCARCHTANGFLSWLPILLDDDPETDPLGNVEVAWTAGTTQPQTCVVCHDPHMVGTVSGNDTDAIIRISGDTPPLIAGFQVFGAGKGAICMTCHNTRRGLRNDANFNTVVGTSEAARAPHGSAQTDILMGQNAYFVEVGIRGAHSLVTDTCVNCHMEQTPPPDLLSYNLGGTNHTFFASETICAKCHGEAFTAEGVQTAFQASANELKSLIEAALLRLISAQIAAGNRIDLGGQSTITNAASIETIDFGETGGQQAITVTLAGNQTIGPMRVNDVRILDAGDANLGGLYDFADARLIKAGWNWNLVNNDGSQGVHNPSFVFQAIDAGIDELVALANEESL